MKYRLLGNSGLRVSELALGTMTFGNEWGWGAPKDESQRLYDAFRDLGGNFVDTANIYTNGTSESFLGEFVKGHRESVVLATKYTNAAAGKDPNAAGNHRKNMMQSVEASLKRLQTHYIDLYWVQIWDQITPVEEIMRGLDDLVRQGKVLYAGISDAPAWWIAQANTLASLRGWSSPTRWGAAWRRWRWHGCAPGPAPDAWAVGDCAGSPHFTHISFDDYRVVRDNLLGGHRVTTERQVPFCMFTDPEFARIGLSETEAKRRGIAYRLARIPMVAVLRTRTLSETRGFKKALLENGSDRIIGFTVFGVAAGETMASVQVAMIAGLPYTALRDAIFTHPTMLEGLSSLFANLPPAFATELQRAA
jgi:hypothetical protein